MANQYYVDALLFPDEPKWDSSKPVSYSFMTNNPDNSNDPNFIAFDKEFQRSLVEQAFQVWSSIANIQFSSIGNSNNGQIRIGFTDLLGQGLADPPRPSGNSNIWIDNFWNTVSWDSTNSDKGQRSFIWYALLHEIGHALGLKHPGPYDVGSDLSCDEAYAQPGNYLPRNEDNAQYSIMSYNDGQCGRVQYTGSSSNAVSDAARLTPLLFDIAAIQYLYGPNYNTRTSNDWYEWNEAFRQTIWDAGGIDTISAANQTVDASIYLNNGSFSSIGSLSDGSTQRATNNLAIAKAVRNGNNVIVNIIENAVGGLGNDIIYGNEANNELRGGAGNDTIRGGSSDLDSLLRPDFIYGDAGNDHLYGDDGEDFLYGGDGNDVISGGGGRNTLYGGNGNDLLEGGDGTDASLSLMLSGDDGDDGLSGGIGDDKLYGGTGNDSLTGWLGRDFLSGDDGNDRLSGWDDDDYLLGGDGNDDLYGGIGNDTLAGGNGNDNYFIDSVSDVINILTPSNKFEDPGTDTVYSSVNFALKDDLEHLTLIDSDSSNANDATSGYGNSLDNKIIGNSANNVLNGKVGNDLLDGKIGDDLMIGGFGNDTYRVDNVDDKATENLNEGIDTIYASISYALGSNLENLTLIGSVAINATGNSLNNKLIGNASDNYLYGGNGIDTLTGNRGDDYLYGQSGNDVVSGGTGDDWLSGDSGNDSLFGSVGRDWLIGGWGDDLISGGNGNDHLVGNLGSDLLAGDSGRDQLSGGDGSDKFIFNSVSEGVDTITDFRLIQGDRIVVSAKGFSKSLKNGKLLNQQFVLGSVAADKSDRFIYNPLTGGLFFDSDGNGAARQVQFAQLAPRLALSNRAIYIAG